MPDTALANVTEFQLTERYAELLAASPMFPNAKTKDEVLVLAALADMVRVHPVYVLLHTAIIGGKPCFDGQMMLMLMYRGIWNGERWVKVMAHFEVVEETNERCVIRVQRVGNPMHTEVFSIEDAQKMQVYENKSGKWVPLATRPNYINQAGTMLKWRCISAIGRTLFPDCLGGISYTPEEMGASVKIDDAGEITIEDPADYSYDDPGHTKARGIDPDDLSNQVIRSDFFAQWKAMGYKPPQILGYAGIKSLADWTHGRGALDAWVKLRMNLIGQADVPAQYQALFAQLLEQVEGEAAH